MRKLLEYSPIPQERRLIWSGCRIPFERALDFANKEKITEILYPLFVHNIGAFLYHPTNTQRTNAVMAAAERRARGDVLSQSQALNQGPMRGRSNSDHIPSSQPPPLQQQHHGMHNPMHQSLPQHSSLAQSRPELQKSMSFPTPPSSASSVMGVAGSDSSYWGGMSQGGNGALAIDTVMNSRSMPTTPATTPPGGIQQLQYPPPNSSLYQPSQSNMGQQSIAQQNMQRFSQQPLPQPSQYIGSRDSNTMGPPTSRGPAPTLSRPSSRQDDAHGKEDPEEQNGLAGEGEDHGAQQVHRDETNENEAEHVHEEEYSSHDNYANGHRSNTVYYPPLTTDHTPHLSPEMSGSPGHGQGPSTPARSTYGTSNVNVPRTVDGGSGATPRTTTTPQQQWVSNGSGYSTPPRTNSANGSAIRQPPSRNLYQLVNGDPAADHSEQTTTGTSEGAYSAQTGLSGVSLPSQTPPQQTFGGNINGTATPSSNKRMREMDDDDEGSSRPSSRGHDDRPLDAEGAGGMKRRKTIREGSTPSTAMAAGNFDRNGDGRPSRTRSTVNPGRVGRRS